MNRPKLCHIIHDGSSAGGGATFSLAYFPGYLGEFDTFAVVGDDGDLAERLRAKGVRTLTLPMSRPIRFISSGPRLWNLLRREKPEVVVVHGQWAGFFGAVAARLAGVKVVLYATQFPSFYTDWDLLRVVRNRIAESVTCRCATRVICLSAAGRYQYLLRRLGPEEKFVHISNGLDPSALTEKLGREALLAELGAQMRPDDQIMVSVSRLSDQKRIDLLLRAWSLVEKQSERARLAIVGSGPDEKALKAYATELGLQRCHFVGRRPNGYRYFASADAGVICSMYEGQPLALIEAMFVGCPMVGTAVDGIGETIIDGVTGLVVPPGDPVALADGMVRLLADPTRAREMGQAARRRAEENYTCDRILRRNIDLAQEELAKARAGSGA